MRISFVLLLLAGIPTMTSHATPQNHQAPFSIAISTDTPVVKAGSDVWIKIQKTNLSTHDIDCTAAPSNATGVDRKYQYDVRDSNQKPLAKIAISHPELESGSIWPCTLKPGQSTPGSANRISGLYDLSHPGNYQIHVSQDVSNNPKAGVVTSNTITLTVTSNAAAVKNATSPFKITIAPYSLGKVGTEAGPFVVNVGAEVGINIVKTNTSEVAEDCTPLHDNVSGLDQKYQYDVRDANGHPVAKHTSLHPQSFAMTNAATVNCTLDPGMSQASVASINRLYDMNRPGIYTIQLSQPVSANPAEGAVKSNTITIKVQ